jgi:protein SCO1/2
MRSLFALLFCFALTQFVVPPPAFAQAPEHDHSQHDHSQHDHSQHNNTGTNELTEPTEPTVRSAAEALSSVGIDEKLGATLPLDAEFTTDSGEVAKLSSLITKPTILVPVFYSCAGTCSLTLHSVATIATRMELTPGVDFNILAISFDDEETLELTQSKKANFLKVAGEKFNPEAWTFAFGNAENINKVMSALGFRYKKLGKNSYSHPNAIMAISPTGRISRYLNGTTYQPFDVSMALEEARREQTGLTVRKMLSYCFDYDPAGGRYILSVTRIALILTLVVGLAFALFLVLGKRRKP